MTSQEKATVKAVYGTLFEAGVQAPKPNASIQAAGGDAATYRNTSATKFTKQLEKAQKGDSTLFNDL